MFAFLMNAKGLISLVMMELGLNEGIITERFYAMGIAYIILSSVTSGPLIGLIYRLTVKRQFRKDMLDSALGPVMRIMLTLHSADSARPIAHLAQLLYANEPRRIEFRVLDVFDDGGGDAADKLDAARQMRDSLRHVLAECRGTGIKVR